MSLQGHHVGDLDAEGVLSPKTMASLVGAEVASVLEAAQEASERIQSKAWTVAEDVQRAIADLQTRLGELAVEMRRITEPRLAPGPSPDRAADPAPVAPTGGGPVTALPDLTDVAHEGQDGSL